MKSYERDIKADIDDKRELPSKLRFSTLQYFWQANPLIGRGSDTIPRFLQQLDIFKNFTSLEQRTLAQTFHQRSFSGQEVIFSENDAGVGFYLIYAGEVEIKAKSLGEGRTLTLKKGEYFGELALLQEKNVRNVNAMAHGDCVLLGLFRPDLDDLIARRPAIAAKLLQSLASLLADRLIFLSENMGESDRGCS